jgi:Heterokaryon incompatibility protein (HET)
VDSWIVGCCADHYECKSILPHLPTRVLDVGPSDGSREPYLLVTNGMRGEYLTLSYCWGKTTAVKTEEANLGDRCREIQCSTLPKTIQDAIYITRKLRFQYLWVDALCIIQDSEDGEDWATESAKMGRIYGDSFLNIAAEAASDSSEGIFAERPPKRGVIVPFYHHRIAAGQVTLQRRITKDPRLTPLSTRAWTLQERLLAKRTLRYDSDSLSCRCKRGATGETEGFRYANTFSKTLVNLLDNSPLYTTVEAALDKWYGLIQEYTPRRLTNENDKLPAISGLAHEFHNIINSQYLAGIWECDLISGLTWRSNRGDGDHVPNPRRLDRGPSWSWVSMDGPVRYSPMERIKKAHRKTMASCRQASINLLTSDCMGAVSGGTVIIDGPLRYARWEYGGGALGLES